MICGIDEAGRGPVMGPLVVASVFVKDEYELKRIGVKDSKKLSPHSREEMFGRIVEIAEYRIITISADEIDSKRVKDSLNDIELQMFADSVSGMKVSEIYADCPDANESAFGYALSQKLDNVKVIAKHKADDIYPAVSAASIIAKVTRDRMMSDISGIFGIDIGSGYPSDPLTVEFIAKWIKENGNPPPHTRRSWETVRKMMTLNMNSRITDW